MKNLTQYEINDLVPYLRERGVAFAVAHHYETGKQKIIGIKITKSDRFFRANGKIISGNIAKLFI